MTENEISYKIIGCALTIHKAIGPWLLESVYESALAYELSEIGLDVRTQVAVPFVYKEIKQDVGFRLDILVEDKVIVEVKSITELAPIHFAQTLTYLKLSNCKLGLLINFNTFLFKDGVRRIINGKL